MQKKAIVSACLLGEFCRYDGKTKQDSAVLNALDGYEIIPFCPEAPLFGTPRERISVVLIDGQKRIITDETKKDVTEDLACEIKRFISQNSHADLIILKSKSPSCGLGTTPILNTQREITACENGIAADLFLKHFSHAKIVDELYLC
ncbi:MAG: DUF523 domain-containing protein [Epsilonproteobacteria bacterium]|nr:DUF523 domain-containing protein [Campylobacterota bacterium]